MVRVINGEKLGFTLGDLNSANGTFLDGQKVTAEIELLPGQTIDLGPGGPKVVFDVEPRPAHLVARTTTIKQPRTTRITAAATASYDSKADRVADAQTDAILLPVLPSGNSLNVEKLRDRHEKTYLAVLWLANVLLFIVIAIIGFVDLNTLLIITLYGAFLAFFVWISWKLSFAFVYCHGIEAGPNQYPQIYSVVKRASELLEVPVPTIIVLQGHGMFELFVAKRFTRRGVIIITSNMLDEFCQRPSSREFMMFIGRQLGHLKAGHFKLWFFKDILGLVAGPFHAAYWRRCHFTADPNRFTCGGRFTCG